MKNFKQSVFITLINIIIFGCAQSEKDIFGVEYAKCKIWWLYDKAISDGPTHLFICFNKGKYNCLPLYKSGILKNRKPINDPFFGGDVVYPLTNYGTWEVRYDSLILQGENFSTIKRISDTIFLRPDAFLLDQTDKFNIENCDCDSLIAQFKGGQVDSIQTILNYQNEKR
jgi:hypothetical protein